MVAIEAAIIEASRDYQYRYGFQATIIHYTMT